MRRTLLVTAPERRSGERERELRAEGADVESIMLTR
jgi:hypothetical protein